MIHRALAPALSLALSLALVAAPAAAKPKNCFAADEMAAEREVEHGVRLREGAARCHYPPFNGNTGPLWQDIEAKNGTHFKSDTDKRAKAFLREFDKRSPAVLAEWNGRMVDFFRFKQMTPDSCADITKLLKDVQKKGWKEFQTQAMKSKAEARLNYKPCG